MQAITTIATPGETAALCHSWYRQDEKGPRGKVKRDP